MRKLSIFSILFLLFVGNISAKINPELIEVPFYEAPKEQKYANYKTYSLYAFYPQAPNTYNVDGYYRAINEGILKEDPINADFKILLDISSITNPGISVKKDSALATAQSITGTIVVFDKTGDVIFRNKYILNTPRASIAGDYTAITAEQKEALQTPLMQKLVENVAQNYVLDFINNFLVTINRTSPSKSPYLGNILNFKTTPREQEISSRVKALTTAATPADLLQTAQEQLEYWNTLAELPDDKENSDYRTVGIYNSAFVYYLLGEQAKSDEYFTRLNNNPGYLTKGFKSFKESFSPNKLKLPVLQGPFAQDENSKSSVNTQELVNNYRYYVIKNAEVVLKDGTIYKGACKISYTDKNASQGNIANLNADDYNVIIEQENGTKATTVLSKISDIKSPGKTFALEKKSLYFAKVEGNKVSIFERVVPNDIILYLYKKPDGDFESTPIFGKGKWYKKYFSDCPALFEKIDKDEIKEPVEMGKFYNNCK